MSRWTSEREYKTIGTYIFVFVLVFAAIVGITAPYPASADSTEVNSVVSPELLLSINDGYITDDTNTLRAVNFELASTDAPVESEVEAEVIVGNYGTESETIDLHPLLFEEGSNTPIDDSYYSVNPAESYEVTLEPGEHTVYRFKIEFHTQGSYDVAIVDGDEPDNLPMAESSVNVLSEGSGTSDTVLMDRDKVTTDTVPVTRYKDMYTLDRDSVGASPSIPPVETDEDGSVVDLDAAEGQIIDFANMRSDTGTSGSISTESGEINVGFSSERLPTDDHYAVSTVYDTHSVDKVEVAIVDSTGEEIDENTEYNLGEVDEPTEVIFQLSSDEIDYLKGQGEIFIQYRNVEGGSSMEIELFEKQVIALNEVWDVPEPDLDIEIESPDSAAVNDRIVVEATIENNGGASATDAFRLLETNIGGSELPVSISDETIVNPGETRVINYVVPMTTEGEHEFEIRGSTTYVDVAGVGERDISPSIETDTDTIAAGDEVEFWVEGLSDEEEDRVEEYRWSFHEDDPLSEGEMEIKHEYADSGSKTVTLEVDYEVDGDIETRQVQTVLDVFDEPEPDIDALYYDFLIDNQDPQGAAIGSSAGGVMESQSCDVSCDASFSFQGLSLTTTKGINMLVFDIDRENHEYNPVFYGAYDVADGEYATTTSVDSDGMSAVAEGLDSGSNAGQAMADDISNYKGDDRYFVFVGGGNPAPASTVSDDVYDSLDSLGAELHDTDSEGELEVNSMWTFASQTLEDGGNTPIHESYVPRTSESDKSSLQHSYEIQPTDAIVGSYAPINRPIHYDVEDSYYLGTREDAEVDWELSSGESEGWYVSESYDETSETHEIEATITDESGISGSEEETVETGDSSPMPVLPDEVSVEVEESTILHASGSHDTDSSVVDYTWVIEDTDETVEISERTPEYEWASPGEYNVRLFAFDKYGNTRYSDITVDVLSAPPEPDADTWRVTADIDGISGHYQESIAPEAHYPLNNVGTGIAADVANDNDGGVIGATTTEGVSDNAAWFDGDSDGIDLPNSENFSFSEEFTATAWVHPDDASEKNTIITNHGDWYFQIDDGRIATYWYGAENEGYHYSETTVPEDEWTHVAVTWDGEFANFYINGEFDNRVESETPADDDTDAVSIGYEADGDYRHFSGGIDDVRVYDTSLSDTGIRSVYEQQGFEPITTQESFYSFGEELVSITHADGLDEGDGTVEEHDDRYFLEADARSHPSSARYIQTEEIDLSNYDTIAMTYEMTTDREYSDGNIESGFVRITTSDREESNHDIVHDHMYTENEGVIEIDVSELDGEQEILVHSHAHSSNGGKTSLDVYELWGETTRALSQSEKSDYYDVFYPHIDDALVHQGTSDGIKFGYEDNSGDGHYMAPAGDAEHVHIEYDVNADMIEESGLNIYADQSTGYSLDSTRAENPQSIVCVSDSELSPECSGDDSDGQFTDGVTLNSGPYSHIGVASSFDGNDYAVIDRIHARADTDETGYPKVYFDGRESETAGEQNEVSKYEWDLNPETSFTADATGATFQHTFQEVDEHAVELRVTDSAGEHATEEITVDITNLEPSLSAVIPTDIYRQEEETFEVGSSTPGDADAAEYTWIFDDGTVTTGESVTHEFEKAGEYEVSVVVADELGLTSSVTETVNVTNRDPDVTSVDEEITAHVRDDITFDGTDAEDPDGNELEYEWELPDGSIEYGETVEYRTERIDEKTAHLTVTDDEGRTAEKTIAVETHNVGPEVEMDIEGVDEEPTLDDAEEVGYVEYPVDVSIDAHHPHPRIDVDYETDMDDGHLYENEAFYEHAFDMPADEYNEDDFPALFDVNSTVIDDYGYDNHDDMSVEVQNHGTNLDIEIEGSEDIPKETDSDGVAYVDDPIEVNVDANHEHEWMDVDFRVEMGDGSVYHNEESFEHNYDVDSDEYSEEDFPVLYDVEGEVEDKYGFDDTDEQTAEIQLREPNVELDASPNIAVIFQDEIQISSTSNSPDSELVEYEYVLGDGTTYTSSSDDDFLHEYTEEGIYQPEVIVEDEYGQQISAFSQVRVVVDFDRAVFLACGIEEGREGPTQNDCEGVYEGTQLEGWVDVNEGVQEWTVPQTGVYHVEAGGARGDGDHGGEGAVIEVERQFDRSGELRIASGLQGTEEDGGTFTAGGGATFVADSGGDPFIIAGGGAASTRWGQDQDASLYTCANDAEQSGSGEAGSGYCQDGVGGQGANRVGGGAGFNTDGGDGDWAGSTIDEVSEAYVNGAIGGGDDADGGFGGGGAARIVSWDRAGGGGGYNGGGGARGDSWAAGGGGSTYVSDDTRSVLTRDHYDNVEQPSEVDIDGTGYVEIELIDAPEVEITAIEITDGGNENEISDGDTIDIDSEIELEADYDSGLSDSPRDTNTWYLGDGATYDTMSTTHEYDSDDEYPITIEVRDDDDVLLAHETMSVTVSD